MRSIVIWLGVLLGAALVAAALGRDSSAQEGRYLVASDAPGSVWRLNVVTGELEHCSLVKGGCDAVDSNR